MFYLKKLGLQEGDRIVKPIFATGISKHHAIFLGSDYFGNEWVVENYFKGGVRLIKAVDFFKKAKSFSVVKFTGNSEQRVKAIQRALFKIGAPYDLINYNCEHFASYVQTGVAFSKQSESARQLIKAAVFCSFTVILVNLLSKN